MVNIYNCGQGDCFEIFPCFLNKSLFIDLGNSSFSLPPRADIDVLITHSHDDHVLGEINKVNSISRIFVPAYFPEFLLINNKLRNKISQYRGTKFELLYEGRTINGYKNIIVHNPPLNPFLLLGIEINSIPSDKEINDYLKSYNTSIQELESIVLESINFFSYEIPEEYDPVNFMRALLAKYMKTRTKKENEHHMCVVFKFEGCDSWLFTGDASIEVFERLKGSNVDLSCNILKVPHHGSRKNLTDDIVKYINPMIAIISHNNRKFGRAKDSHPNQEILDILRNNNIDFYATNDIIKNGVILQKQHLGPIFPYCAQIL